MMKYREDLKTILQVLSYVLIYLLISIVKNPIAVSVAWGILILLILYEIYSKIHYRTGNASYILFPTMNDNYSKTTAIILGVIISGLSFGAMIYWNAINEYTIIGTVLGISVLTNGLLSLPNGRLKIKRNLLSISSLPDSIDQHELKEIHLSKEQILLIPIQGEIKRVSNLDLDSKSAQFIQNYISKHQTNPDLLIINRLNQTTDVTDL